MNRIANQLQTQTKQVTVITTYQHIQFETQIYKKKQKNIRIFKQEIIPKTQNNKSSILLRSAKALKKFIQKLERCPICSEQKQSSLFSSISDCIHKYCKQCAIKYFINKINNQRIIQCPQCDKPVNKESNAFKNLTVHQKNKYHKIEVIQSIKFDNKKKLCPTDNCLGILNIKDVPMICQICKLKFCKCFMKVHQGQCNFHLRDQLVNKFGFKQCPNCKLIIEKNKGCEHITCKCSHQFCFICLRQWKQGHLCNQAPRYQQRTLTTNLFKLFLFNFTFFVFYIVGGIVSIGVYFLVLIFPLPFFFAFVIGFQKYILLASNNTLSIYKQTSYTIGIFLFFPILYLYCVGCFYAFHVKDVIINLTQQIRIIFIRVIEGLEIALHMRV